VPWYACNNYLCPSDGSRFATNTVATAFAHCTASEQLLTFATRGDTEGWKKTLYQALTTFGEGQ